MDHEDIEYVKITTPQLLDGLKKNKMTLNGKDFIILSKFDLNSVKNFCEKNHSKTYTAIKKDKNTFKMSYIKGQSAVFKLIFQKKNDDIAHKGINLEKDYKKHSGFKKSIEEYTKKDSGYTKNQPTQNDNMTSFKALKKFHKFGYEWVFKHAKVESCLSNIVYDYNYKNKNKYNKDSIMELYFNKNLHSVKFSPDYLNKDLENALDNTGTKILELRKKAKEIGIDKPSSGQIKQLIDLEENNYPLSSQYFRAYSYFKNKNSPNINKEIGSIIEIIKYYDEFTGIGSSSHNYPTTHQIDLLLTFKGLLSNWSHPLIDHRLISSYELKNEALLTPTRVSAAEYLGKYNIFLDDNYLPYVNTTSYALSKIDKPSRSEIKAVAHFWSSFKIERPEPEQIKLLAVIFDEGEEKPTQQQYNAALYMKTHFPKKKIDLRKINLVADVMTAGILQPSTQDMQATKCLIEKLKIDKPSDKLIVWVKNFREKFKKDPIRGEIPLGL
jgi:hypothetical protein